MKWLNDVRCHRAAKKADREWMRWQSDHPSDIDVYFWLQERRCGEIDLNFVYLLDSSTRFHKPTQPHALDRPHPDFGVLHWSVCHTHDHAKVRKISIATHLQRRGLGTLLIRYAVAKDPDATTWSTTQQSPEGQAFFPAMARQHGAENFSESGPCTCDGWSSAEVTVTSQPVTISGTRVR